MKKLIKDESGLAVIEASIIFPIVLLATIVFFLLTIFLFERINLQKSLDWYVDRLSVSIGISYGDMLPSPENNALDNPVITSPISAPKFPYRYFLSENAKVNDFKNAVLEYSDKYSAQPIYDYQIDVKVKNYIIYQEVTASAAKKFKMPINFSFIGIDSDPTLYAVSKRMSHDPDEFIRSVDLVFDASNYINEKYQITDKISTMFETVGKIFSKSEN